MENKAGTTNGSAPKVLDIAKAAGDLGLELALNTAENNDERASRLRIAEAEADALRRREWITFLAALTALTLGGVGCVWLFTNATVADDKIFARTFLQTMLVGSIGYVLGRKKG